MLVSDLRYTELETLTRKHIAVHNAPSDGMLLVYRDVVQGDYRVFVYTPTFRKEWNCGNDLELQCVLHEVFAGATYVVD